MTIKNISNVAIGVGRIKDSLSKYMTIVHIAIIHHGKKIKESGIIHNK